MRIPPLPADFTHARVCKPFCEKYLTLPKPGGPRRRKAVRFYIRGEQAEPGRNSRTGLFLKDSSQAARGGGRMFVFISEESRLSLDPIRAPGFFEGSSQAARGGGRMFAFIS